MSWSLEAYLNDFGLAMMADRLADDPAVPAERRARLREEASYLHRRSLNYVLLFDPEINFFQGRRPDGRFAKTPEEFDPCEWGGDFTETDGWNFAFHVAHDGRGLANLYGGPRGLEAKLDEFFATPELATKKGTYSIVIHEMLEAQAVRMGQFGFSNQPAHHIAWIYNYAGTPHKTQAIVREVLQRLYVGEEIGQGYPGDEDNGEMSAWYLFSALGIYPLRVGAPEYAIGSPLFSRTVVTPLGGDAARDHCIGSRAPLRAGSPRRRQAVADGIHHGRGPARRRRTPLRPRSGAVRLGHPRLAAGAHHRRRDPDPAGRPDPASETTPSSTTTHPPNPLRHPHHLVPTGARHRHLLHAHIRPLRRRPNRLAPRSLSDGTTWSVLDERTDQSFVWRRQTRPFTIAHPASTCTTAW